MTLKDLTGKTHSGVFLVGSCMPHVQGCCCWGRAAIKGAGAGGLPREDFPLAPQARGL